MNFENIRKQIKVLGIKQREDNDKFMHVWDNIQSIVPKDYIDNLIDYTVEQVKDRIKGKRCAFSWSGGKDSLALQYIMEQVGVHDCLMGITQELDYPEFLQWVTDHMPYELELINTGQDLKWLSENMEMLFPQNATVAAKWFKQVQHTAQEIYFKKHDLDMLIMGRRSLDHNYTGKSGQDMYINKKGILRYSPLKDWIHEEVMAVMSYYNMGLPPIYRYPNGWVVGTGPWPARQWTGSKMKGWYEIWIIDHDLVKRAAKVIPSAELFLKRYT